MKLLLPCLLSILLPLSSSSSSSSSSTTAPSSLVYDTSNQPLRRGQTYFILPGLSLAHRTTTPCPLYVTESTSSPGLPLTFSPANPRSNLIHLSTDFNVAFAAATICVQSTAWQLGGLEAGSGKRYVSIGGVLGKPGLSTVSNWFRIDKYGNDSYKLVFCPGVCSYCKVVCGDLGVYEEDGKRWVGLSDVPLTVVFNKTST